MTPQRYRSEPDKGLSPIHRVRINMDGHWQGLSCGAHDGSAPSLELDQIIAAGLLTQRRIGKHGRKQ